MLLASLLVSSALALVPLASASSPLNSTSTRSLGLAYTSATAAAPQPMSSSVAPAMPSAAVQAPTPAASANIDVVVFNLALTLERLESSFYTQALAKFDLSAFVQAGYSELQAIVIIEQVSIIAFDESAHVEVITEALKAAGTTPFECCDFNFDSVLSDPVTFVAVARSLEAVGVGAYLGAARLITDSALLTAAASIATLEARHQTLLNVLNGGTSAPQAFDLALAPEQVLSLAGGLLSNCSASDLGLTANPPLSIESDKGDTSFTVGSKLVFAASIELDVEMIVGGAAVAQIAPASACYIPEGVDGPVAVYLTNTTPPLQSNLINQDARGIQAGPGLIFVDSISTALGSLFNKQGAHPSADMGALYAAKLTGETAVIQIVKQVTVTETETVIISGGKAEPKSRMIKVKRGSAGPRRGSCG